MSQKGLGAFVAHRDRGRMTMRLAYNGLLLWRSTRPGRARRVEGFLEIQMSCEDSWDLRDCFGIFAVKHDIFHESNVLCFARVSDYNL